jgi:4-amino-4-deoxy-L-arabinose transferase-like glycosyltransferase
MVLELAVSEKKFGYLLGVVLIYLLYKKFLGTIITDGYADVPVAFMAWIALIPYLRNEDILSDKKEFFLSLILAAAAALTKQVGLYIIVLLPVIAFLNSNVKSKKLVRLCLLGLALGILLVLPWYLPRAIQVNTGAQDLGLERYMSHSTDVQDTDNLLLRPVLAMLGLGKYLIPYIFSLFAIPFLMRRWRLLVIFFIIPFSILWGVVASYSVRNLSVTFPALAIIVGLAAQVCLDFGWGLFSRIKAGKLSASLLLLVILAPILYYGFKLDDETVIARWREAQSQIFSPEINAQLYALDYSQEGCKSILTNYPVSYLPGLEDRMVEFYFTDFGMYQKFVADPSVCWMLVPINRALDTVNDDINARLDDGSYQLIFESDNWVPYELIKIR